MTFVKCAYTHFDKDELTKAELDVITTTYDVKSPGWIQRPEFRTSSGLYKLPIDGKLPESLKVKFDVESTNGDFPLETYNNIVPMKKSAVSAVSSTPQVIQPQQQAEIIDLPKEGVFSINL